MEVKSNDLLLSKQKTLKDLLSKLTLEYDRTVRKVLHNGAYELPYKLMQGRLSGAHISGMLDSFKKGMPLKEIKEVAPEKRDEYQRYRLYSQESFTEHILEVANNNEESVLKLEAYNVFIKDLELELIEKRDKTWMEIDENDYHPSKVLQELSEELFYILSFFQENKQNLISIDRYFESVRRFEGMSEDKIVERLTDMGVYEAYEERYLPEKAMIPIYFLINNSIQPYKEREIDEFKEKEIYRNLHKDGFSIKQSGKVVAHGTNFIATDVSFKVSEAGRQRVLEKKQKAVHASLSVEYIRPMIILPFDLSGNDIEEDLSKYYDEVYYNPYKHDTFINRRTGEKLTGTLDAVYFAQGRVFIIPDPEIFVTREYGVM